MIADLIIGVCSAPFYALMLFCQGSGFIDSVMWIPPLDASRVWYDFGSVYFMHVADSVTFHFMHVPTPKVLIWLIEAVLVLSVGAAAWALRRRPAMLAVLGISFLFLPLTFTVISIWRPISGIGMRRVTMPTISAKKSAGRNQNVLPVIRSRKKSFQLGVVWSMKRAKGMVAAAKMQAHRMYG